MKTTLTRAAALIAAFALAAPAFAQTIDLGAGAGANGSSGNASTSANVDINVGDDTATSSDSTDTDSDTGLTGSVSAVIDPLTVRTDADLETYAEATVSSDERVQDVNVSDDEVSIEYDERAHLFGIFPILVTATATVDAQGNVSVRYPWYRFLMSTEHEALEASATAEVRATLSEGASMDAQAKARALAALHRAMKAQFEADVSASADAEAEASN